MKKKILSVVLASVMMLSLAACGSTESSAPSTTDADAAATEDTAAADDAATEDAAAADDAASDESYTVGICQLVQHDALDAATQGFKDSLIEELGEDKVTFDEQNAQGDPATCATVVNGFVSSGVDLILANATPALQAAAADRKSTRLNSSH